MDIFNTLIEHAEKIFFSVWVSIGFAMLFNTPRRALLISGLLGGIGFGVRAIMMKAIIPDQIVLASFCGACMVGFLGVYFAHRVHTPPAVFTIPAVINMIPGKFGYEFMMGLIKIVTTTKSNDISHELIAETISYGLKTGFITMALSLGVVAPLFFLNTYTVKDKDLHKYIRKKLLKKR